MLISPEKTGKLDLETGSGEGGGASAAAESWTTFNMAAAETKK